MYLSLVEEREEWVELAFLGYTQTNNLRCVRSKLEGEREKKLVKQNSNREKTIIVSITAFLTVIKFSFCFNYMKTPVTKSGKLPAPTRRKSAIIVGLPPQYISEPKPLLGLFRTLEPPKIKRVTPQH